MFGFSAPPISAADCGLEVFVVEDVGYAAKVAEITYASWMLFKVYELTAPTDVPLTVTSAM